MCLAAAGCLLFDVCRLLPPPPAAYMPGVKLDGQSVTLEPGGQFELSGAPVATLHQTCAEVNSHLYQVSG